QRLIPLDTTTGYATNLATAAANEDVSLNAGGTVAVNAGGQTVNALRFGAAATLSGAASDVLTVTSGAVLSTTSTSTINAPLDFGAAEGVVYASGALTINGAIAGSNGLTKAGIGILTLSAANTYTGPTTLTLGSTYVPGGVVTADGSAPSVFGQDTSPITISNSAITSTRLYTTGALTINRDIVVKLGGAAATGIGTSGATTNESVTINCNVTLKASSSQSLARFLSLEGGDTEAEAVRINGNISGSGGLRATLAAYSILTGNNSYSGSTLVGTSTFTGGSGNTFQVFTETWDARSSTAFGTGPIYFHSTTSTTQPVTGTGLSVSGGSGPNTFANDVILTNGFARFGGSQPLTLNGGMFLNAAATNNSVISVESTTAPVTLNGIINGGGVIKHGAGTLTFTGANTYSGQTIVREGTLSATTIGNGGTIGNLGQAPANSVYLVLTGNAVGNTGTLAYSGAGESTDRLFTMQGSGGTIDASGSGALVLANTGTIGQNAATVSFTTSLVTSVGVVGLQSSHAAQIVVGSTVTASGAGIPAGTTVTEVGVNFVRLSANGTNTAGAQTLTFTPPAALTSRVLTLTGSNTGNNTLAAVIADASGLPVSLVKNGSGTWRLSGANTYTGATTVQAGRLIGTTTSLQGTITTNAALEFNQTTGGTFAGDIDGTGLFEKTGAGRLTLTGTALNTGFTGTVGVTGGILEVAPTTSLGAGPVTVGSGASLEVRGTLTSTGVTIGSGATLTGTGAINGNVLINGTLAPGGGPGTLSITGDLGLSAGSVLDFDLAETNQTAGGGINDLVIVNGNLVLDGTLNVPDPTAVSAWTTDATATDPIAWTLFTFTGSVVDNGLALGNLPTITGTAGPLAWQIGIVLNQGGGGSVKLVAVPEPSTALLVTGALVTGTVYLRRRRRTA
ncbi:MAG: beta strand repeat-containing protein, partial [Planctomycetia bacterium]